MCILFVYVNPTPDDCKYKLILASNRDEIFSRPAQPLHQWSNHPAVYGGKDMQPGKEGGTWLAMNKNGRIGVLLNIGQGKELTHTDANSGRGFYAIEWIADSTKNMDEVYEIVKQKHGINPALFRLVTIDLDEPKVGTLTHIGGNEDGYRVEYHQPGFLAMGNNADGFTWKKVQEGKSQFQIIVENSSSSSDTQKIIEDLVDMLSCKTKYFPDPELEKQMEGRPEKVLECLSSIFVEIPKVYGTRTQSVILVDANNQVTFFERTMDGIPGNSPVNWITNCHSFQIDE